MGLCDLLMQLLNTRLLALPVCKVLQNNDLGSGIMGNGGSGYFQGQGHGQLGVLPRHNIERWLTGLKFPDPGMANRGTFPLSTTAYA